MYYYNRDSAYMYVVNKNYMCGMSVEGEQVEFILDIIKPMLIVILRRYTPFGTCISHFPL